MTALPGWAAHDRVARAAWSRLVEPEDAVAGAVLAVLGAVEAVGHVLSGDPLPSSEANASRLAAASRRWRVRLPGLDPERDIAAFEGQGGRVVVPSDDEWPAGLDALDRERPACLWVRGEVPLGPVLERSASVVGSRLATPYGQRVAADLGAGLADRGICVVSGAAFGIDAGAHRGCLAAKGTTLAVLACGADRFYPQAHENMLRRIVERGAVLSEHPPGSAPFAHRFLQRNRLIAALTGATVVVEAAWRSGAISTARRAAGLGRPLGAVPGPVDAPTSAGCHRLLRDLSATCVRDAADVAEMVGVIGAGYRDPPPVPRLDHDDLDPTQRRVLDALPVVRGQPVPRVAAVAGLPADLTSSALAHLELAGLAERQPGEGDGYRWRRRRPTPPDLLRPQPPQQGGVEPG